MESLIHEVDSFLKDLNALSVDKHPELGNSAQDISNKILWELLRRREFEETNPALPVERFSLENATDVGGEAADFGRRSGRFSSSPGF